MEIVRRPHARNLVRFAAHKPEVLVLSADLTSSCEADDFRAAYPERFFSVGMAEQNMLSLAGGLAREGMLPHVHTFAVFICRRAFDQVAMSVAYPNLRVRLVGFLPGLTTPGGVTHQAIDDVALMRVLPNMTILECGDATEVESALDVAHGVPGPVYLRMLRGEVPRLFSSSDPMVLGQMRLVSRGADLLVVSSGVCTEEAMRAVLALRRKGVSAAHLHVSTLKPLSGDGLCDFASEARLGVITMENHSVVGGLGSAVAEALAERGVGKRLVRLGVQDQYAHGASKSYLLAKYGLDARALIGAAERLCEAPLDIADGELLGVDKGPADEQSKAEAL
ncbi:MAG: transketolase [Myxococcota bacterium]|nr:transketolase [Myxococcota bacterium]